ncbi:MAG: hypothetical protein RIE73_04800 [Coleofasciculus sp. C1-SOL-03]
MTVLHVAPMGTQRLADELLGRLVVRSRYDIVDLIGKYGSRSHKQKKIVTELREVTKKR